MSFISLSELCGANRTCDNNICKSYCQTDDDCYNFDTNMHQVCIRGVCRDRCIDGECNR